MNIKTEVTITEKINQDQPLRWITTVVTDGHPGEVKLVGSIAEGEKQHFSIKYKEIDALIAALEDIKAQVILETKEDRMT